MTAPATPAADTNAMRERLHQAVVADEYLDGIRISHSDALAILALLATDRAAGVGGRLATVEDYNAAFDPADEAMGGAFRAGFREGWIYAQAPDGDGYDELVEQFGRAVDIEPSEAWDGHRDEFFAMLPLAAIPEVGQPLAASPPAPADASGEVEVAARSINGKAGA